MMTTNKDIELCAKALGMRYRIDSGVLVELFEDGHAEWSPRTVQLDSDNMACDLEIDTKFCPNAVVCWKHQIRKQALHDGTSEGRRAAAREARALVAAQMGRAE